MKLQSPIDKHIVTTVGYTFSFKAGEPIDVPPTAIQDCLHAGCHVSKGETLKGEEKEVAKVVQGPERERLICEAIRKLVARNVRGDFTGSGKPDATVLSKIVNFNVTAVERDILWPSVAQTIGEEAV